MASKRRSAHSLREASALRPVCRCPKQREATLTTASRSSLPQRRIENHREADAYRLVLWLQEETKVGLRVDVSGTRDFLLRGADWASSTTLVEITGHDCRFPTRQVLVTLRGPVPVSLDLGCWGCFACRPLVSEPVLCFRCLAFGRFQRQCRRDACATDTTRRGDASAAAAVGTAVNALRYVLATMKLALCLEPPMPSKAPPGPWSTTTMHERRPPSP